MTRVSPPELARELPGPQASTSVTRAPWRRRNSAVQPPNAPAPTTTMRGEGCLLIGTQPPRAAAAAALDLRNDRRSNVREPRAPRAGRPRAPQPVTPDPMDHRTRHWGSRHLPRAPTAYGECSLPSGR